MNLTSETEIIDQLPEAPQTKLSKALAKVGWILVLLWVAGVGGYTVWEVWVRPRLWAGSVDEPIGRKLAIFSGIFGFVLLLVSVLLDRIKTSKTDRYRRVQK